MLGSLLHQVWTPGRLLCPNSQACVKKVIVRFASQTHYDVLGVPKTASQREIRSAFLSLSKQIHPDVNSKDPKNHEKFVILNDAYTTLSKPVLRHQYDLNLADRILSERHARNVYSSHVHGSSAWPGSNYDRSFDTEHQRFWDETIWSMRDKSKDKYYASRPYYGFGTTQRLPNSYILFGCFVLIGFGFALHFLAIQRSRAIHMAWDQKDKDNFNILSEARKRARIHGNIVQLQNLQNKMKKTPLEVDAFSEDRSTITFRKDLSK